MTPLETLLAEVERHLTYAPNGMRQWLNGAVAVKLLAIVRAQDEALGLIAEWPVEGWMEIALAARARANSIAEGKG